MNQLTTEQPQRDEDTGLLTTLPTLLAEETSEISEEVRQKVTSSIRVAALSTTEELKNHAINLIQDAIAQDISTVKATLRELLPQPDPKGKEPSRFEYLNFSEQEKDIACLSAQVLFQIEGKNCAPYLISIAHKLRGEATDEVIVAVAQWMDEPAIVDEMLAYAPMAYADQEEHCLAALIQIVDDSRVATALLDQNGLGYRRAIPEITLDALEKPGMKELLYQWGTKGGKPWDNLERKQREEFLEGLLTHKEDDKIWEIIMNIVEKSSYYTTPLGVIEILSHRPTCPRAATQLVHYGFSRHVIDKGTQYSSSYHGGGYFAVRSLHWNYPEEVRERARELLAENIPDEAVAKVLADNYLDGSLGMRPFLEAHSGQSALHRQLAARLTDRSDQVRTLAADIIYSSDDALKLVHPLLTDKRQDVVELGVELIEKRYEPSPPQETSWSIPTVAPHLSRGDWDC